MILMQAIPFRGPLDFFGLKWHSLHWLLFQAQKSLDFQGQPLPMAPIEIVKSQHHIKNRYIGNFMYTLWLCVSWVSLVADMKLP